MDDCDAERNVYVCIVHGKKRQVMVRKEGEHIFFPMLKSSLNTSLSQCIQKYIYEKFGISELVENGNIIQIYDEPTVDEESDSVSVIIIELENAINLTGKPFEWTDKSSAIIELFKSNENKKACTFIESFLNNSNIEELSPWCRENYLSTVNDSIRKQLNDLGIKVVNEGQQYYFSNRSIVYQLVTTAGSMFYKLTDTRSREPVNTAIITRILPDEFSGFLLTSSKNDFLVMSDLGTNLSELYNASATIKKKFGYADGCSLYRDMFERWAFIQKKSMKQISKLLAAGLPYYDKERIEMETIKLFQLCKDQSIDIEFADHEMESALSQIDASFKAWSSSKIPVTLIHGDLHEENVSFDANTRNSAIHFFELEFSFVGCPFLDMPSGIPRSKYEFYYLRCWREYGDLESLRTLEHMKELKTLLFVIFMSKSEHVSRRERNDYIEWNLEKYLDHVERYSKSGTCVSND